MIRQFSATEKVCFGALVMVLAVSALVLVTRVNNLFTVAVPAHGGTMSEAVIGLPRLVNPVLAVTDIDRDLDAIIYAGLMRYDHGKLVPNLAKSYSVSDDGLTYSIILRDDIRFHDGNPVTADDVEFTIQKIQNPIIQSPRRVDWKDVSVKKISATEIEFELKQPYAPFLNNLTVGILPKHIWKNVDPNQFIFSQFNIEPIGAGPYQLDTIDRDGGGIPVAYNLVPFDRYVGGNAYIANLIIRFYQDEKSALDAVKTGAADSLASASSQETGKIATTTPAGLRILSTPLPRIFAVFLNQNTPLFANKEVRQALAMSVDKDRLVNDVLDGYGVRIDSPLPHDTAETSATPADKEGARRLLEKAGWVMGTDGIYEKKVKKDITRLTFSITTANDPDLKQSAEFVKNEWKQIGVDVSIKVFEAADLTQDIIRGRKYESILFGEVIGKDLDLYAFWHSSQRNSPGLNLSMYVNSKADKLLDDARQISDADGRIAKYSAVEDIIRDDAPAIFLYSPKFIYIVPDKVKGVTLDHITAPQDRWNNVNSWFIATDNVWTIFTKIKLN